MRAVDAHEDLATADGHQVERPEGRQRLEARLPHQRRIPRVTLRPDEQTPGAILEVEGRRGDQVAQSAWPRPRWQGPLSPSSAIVEK